LTARSPADLSSLAGGGEAARAISEVDWEQTPLGPVSAWPSELKSTLRLISGSLFPSYLAWGPSLISFHNEAFLPLLAGRPSAMGRPAPEVWPEVWADIAPYVLKAQAGEASFVENLPLVVERAGRPTATWRTLSCSPVRLEDGSVAGVLWTTYDTTQSVLAERRQAFLIELSDALRELAAPDAITLAAAELLGRYLRVNRAGYGEIDGTGEVVKVERDWTDGTAASLADEARVLDAFGPEVIAELRSGKTLVVEDCRSDPRTSAPRYLPTWESIGTRALVVTPLLRDARLTAIVYAHSASPRSWDALDVRLVEDVASRTASAVERAQVEGRLRAALEAEREAQERFNLAQEVGGIGAWEWDMLADQGQVSDTYKRMHGLEHIQGPLRFKDVLTAVHPSDRAGYLARLDAATRRSEPSSNEYRVVLKDGSIRWIGAKGRPLVDASGVATRALGVVIDLTERKEAEERLGLLMQEVDHRANNLMTVIQGAVSLSRAEDPEELRQTIVGRVEALARAHQLLAVSRWRGADLRRLVEEELAPFTLGDGERVSIEGPSLPLGPAAAQGIAMVLHELATNAAKHGALSAREGRVNIRWSTADDRLNFRWVESGGPRAEAPAKRGFGTTVLQRALSGSLRGSTELNWRPEGLACELSLPLAANQSGTEEN
jgi:PAS domain S-box-containing protein